MVRGGGCCRFIEGSEFIVQVLVVSLWLQQSTLKPYRFCWCHSGSNCQPSPPASPENTSKLPNSPANIISNPKGFGRVTLAPTLQPSNLKVPHPPKPCTL